MQCSSQKNVIEWGLGSPKVIKAAKRPIKGGLGACSPKMFVILEALRCNLVHSRGKMLQNKYQ